jgi:hypothetical protein
LRAVNTAISQGFVYGIELDIRDFYPSVKLGHLLATLRYVPSRMTENVVWTGDDVSLIGRDGVLYRDMAIGSNSRSPRGLALKDQPPLPSPPKPYWPAYSTASRKPGPLFPRQMRYQAAIRPDCAET